MKYKIATEYIDYLLSRRKKLILIIVLSFLLLAPLLIWKYTGAFISVVYIGFFMLFGLYMSERKRFKEKITALQSTTIEIDDTCLIFDMSYGKQVFYLNRINEIHVVPGVWPVINIRINFSGKLVLQGFREVDEIVVKLMRRKE